MLRFLALVIDLLLAVAAILIAGILLSGGTEFYLGARLIRLHSVGNLVLICSLLGAARFSSANRWRLCGVEAWSRNGIAKGALRFLSRIQAASRELPSRQAWAIVGGVGGAVLLAKLANAWFYYGFFSGDDVEVQEMSLASLYHWNWEAWSLRSAFYPFAFIYPAHALAKAAGFGSPFALVFAGRAVVAVLSTLGMFALFAAACRAYDRRTALVFCIVLGSSGLLLAFGGSELPRPIAAVFVGLAFLVLRRPATAGAIGCGALLGLAAAMRFSEVIFAIPAALLLLFDKDIKRLTAFVVTFVMVALAIQTMADWIYWGSPLHSAIEAYSYTITKGLSSRGYEPFWYYLANVPSWTNYAVLAAALYGTRRETWREALPVWLPIVILSGLPHKEPRYLIPLIPAMSLLAAIGAIRFLDGLLADSRRGRAVVLVWCCACALVLGLGSGRFRRTEEDVILAQHLVRSVQPETPIAAEQVWRMGNRIYLGGQRRIVNLDRDVVQSGETLADLLEGVEVVAVMRSTCRESSCHAALARLSFSETQLGSVDFVVFRRRQ